MGLNAPKEVIHAIKKSGTDGLPVEMRRSLAEKIHLEDPTYERLMNSLLSVHASFDTAFLRHFFEAQAHQPDDGAK